MFVSSVAMAGIPCNQGNLFGSRQAFQTNVAKLHSHGRAGMCLQRKEPCGSSFLNIVISHIDCLDVVDEMLKVIAVGDDVVLIPVFLFDFRLNLFCVTDFSSFFDFKFSILANQLRCLTTQGQNPAILFAVQNS